MKIYGLIGRSLGHSFSKEYFKKKFERENIHDCTYLNFELKDLKKEVPALKKEPNIKGLNVTIPYKTDIIPFLDETSAEVAEIGACNCVQIQDGKWKGFNTDVAGFEKSFLPHLRSVHKKALVLGTGGASKAVVFVLKKLGIDFLKVSRNKSNAGSVISYEDVLPEMLREFQIVINCTPVGTFPAVEEFPPLPYESVSSDNYFFDLIYNPAKTVFLAAAEKRGATIENGSNMLAIQADESWKIWNE